MCKNFRPKNFSEKEIELLDKVVSWSTDTGIKTKFETEDDYNIFSSLVEREFENVATYIFVRTGKMIGQPRKVED